MDGVGLDRERFFRPEVREREREKLRARSSYEGIGGGISCCEKSGGGFRYEEALDGGTLLSSW